MTKMNTTYSSHPNHASKRAHQQAKTQYPTYDTTLIRPQKKEISKPKLFLCILIAVIVIGVIGFFIFMNSVKTLDAGKTAEVTIDEGSSTWDIANKMSEEGVVSNAFVFKITAMQMGAETQLKPGTYIFEGGKSVGDYIQILCDGPDKFAPKIVITEGMKLTDIAKKVEQSTNGKISSNNFIDVTKDASVYVGDYPFLKDAGNNTLEGFLFPKTYSFASNTNATDIVRDMLDQFSKEYKTLDLSYPSSLNFSIYEVVNLASIVEKESASGFQKKVASVFYNRLKANMYLNSDATTAYVVGHDPTSAEVHSNNEYSTYTNYGLPPTPICSPGKDALEAVCHPEQTNYLFFAFKPDSDGKMQYRFSETFEEHQQALIDLGIV